MGLLASISTEHEADIIIIQPFYIGIIKCQAIGGKGQLENLAGLLLTLSDIFCNILDQRHIN